MSARLSKLKGEKYAVPDCATRPQRRRTGLRPRHQGTGASSNQFDERTSQDVPES